jgi:RNA recognition motif-containing protein
MKNIFVGNLDFHTNEDELRQLFSQYGQVDKVSEDYLLDKSMLLDVHSFSWQASLISS